MTPVQAPAQISVNQLKTWSRCKKKYEYDYVKKLRWPTDGSHFRLGREVHKLLDYQARGLEFDLLLQEAADDVHQSWLLLRQAPITQLPILGSEWAFQVPLGDFWLVGRMDRIAANGEQVLVIDWKTGTGVPKLPETDWQTIVYLYATVEACHDLGRPGLSPEQTRFVYVEVKNQVREVEVPYSLEKHAAAKTQLLETMREIQQAKTYPLPPECPDRHCPYGSICGIHDRVPTIA